MRPLTTNARHLFPKKVIAARERIKRKSSNSLFWMVDMTRIKRKQAGLFDPSPMKLVLLFALCILCGLVAHVASADDQASSQTTLNNKSNEATNEKHNQSHNQLQQQQQQQPDQQSRQLRTSKVAKNGGGNNGKDELESKRFIVELNKLVEANGQQHASSERVVIETRPAWAPIGVAHFHELVANGFYDECKFFRVIPNFMVQFGINADPKVQKKWRRNVLKDDPVKYTNQRGTVTYATAGPNTRTSQLFVNTNENGNAFLDKQGFAPFAEVVEGMEFIDMIDSEYREKPDQGRIQSNGNKYLDKNFPNLSYIMTIREDKGDTPDTEGGGR